MGKRDKKGNEYWDNECDAFKHAYMQAYMTTVYNDKMAEKSYSEKFSDKIRENYKNKKSNYIINFKADNSFQSTANSHWVTINGKHVLIES